MVKNQVAAVKQFILGDDSADTGLSRDVLETIRSAVNLAMVDGSLFRMANEQVQKVAKERKRIVLATAGELYPDKSQIPSPKAIAEKSGLSLTAVEIAVASLKKARRWGWRQPLNRKKLGLAPLKPYAGQPFPVAVNLFVRDYAKENKGSVPSVDLIAKTLGRTEKYTGETVKKMKENGKWPVKNWA